MMTEIRLNTIRAAEVLGVAATTVRQACAKYWAIVDAQGEETARQRAHDGSILVCQREGYGQRATYYLNPADLADYRPNTASGRRGWPSGMSRPPDKRKPTNAEREARKKSTNG